jgi:hypothetical protein
VSPPAMAAAPLCAACGAPLAAPAHQPGQLLGPPQQHGAQPPPRGLVDGAAAVEVQEVGARLGRLQPRRHPLVNHVGGNLHAWGQRRRRGTQAALALYDTAAFQ